MPALIVQGLDQFSRLEVQLHALLLAVLYATHATITVGVVLMIVAWAQLHSFVGCN